MTNDANDEGDDTAPAKDVPFYGRVIRVYEDIKGDTFPYNSKSCVHKGEVACTTADVECNDCSGFNGGVATPFEHDYISCTISPETGDDLNGWSLYKDFAAPIGLGFLARGYNYESSPVKPYIKVSADKGKRYCFSSSNRMSRVDICSGPSPVARLVLPSLSNDDIDVVIYTDADGVFTIDVS
jgi:hypothetical protein